MSGSPMARRDRFSVVSLRRDSKAVLKKLDLDGISALWI